MTAGRRQESLNTENSQSDTRSTQNTTVTTVFLPAGWTVIPAEPGWLLHLCFLFVSSIYVELTALLCFVFIGSGSVN